MPSSEVLGTDAGRAEVRGLSASGRAGTGVRVCNRELAELIFVVSTDAIRFTGTAAGLISGCGGDGVFSNCGGGARSSAFRKRRGAEVWGGAATAAVEPALTAAGLATDAEAPYALHNLGAHDPDRGVVFAEAQTPQNVLNLMIKHKPDLVREHRFRPYFFIAADCAHLAPQHEPSPLKTLLGEPVVRVSGTQPAALQQLSRALEEKAAGLKMSITLDGRRVNVIFDPEKHSILDNVRAAGLPAPFACKGGVCATCRAKVTAGEVSMKVNYGLSDQELADGYVLTCQATPLTDDVALTYDV